MAPVPVIGAINGWPIWLQILASAGVAFVWLTLLTGIIDFFKRKSKHGSRSDQTQSVSKSQNAQAQQATAGGNVTQVQTGAIHYGDIYNLTLNVTPEMLEGIMSEQPRQQAHIHVESHNQQGGITAGVVNIHEDLGPKVHLSEITHTELQNAHRYEAVLSIDSNYSVPQIRIVAHADSIQSLDVAPQRSGMHTFGHTGKREGYHFTTIQNAAGKYRIRVTTAKPEEVTIDLE